MGASEAAWIDALTAPHTHTSVQAGPTGSSQFGAPGPGSGWYGQHSGVQNIADHLKSLHICPKWMDNAFWGDGCCILAIMYNTIGSATAILAPNEWYSAAVMGRWRQVRDTEAPLTPQNPSYVSLNDQWGPLKRWIDRHHTPICLSRQAPLAALS